MKKISKAFTLAEVLVTLAVIGVVVALTISTLTKSWQEAAWKAAWKKKYSEVAQATQMIIADRGDMTGYANGQHGDLRTLYSQYITFMITCGYSDQHGKCWHNNNEWYSYDGITPLTTGAISIGLPAVMKDGSFISFDAVNEACSYGDSYWIGNYMVCGWIYVDTNGFKGLNVRGKDINQILITKYGVKPRGSYGDDRPADLEAALLIN